MNYFVFVDAHNTWSDGKYASAVLKGWSEDMFFAKKAKAADNAWRIDFGKLLSYVTEGNIADVKRVMLFGTTPSRNDSIWGLFGESDSVLSVYEKKSDNKGKSVDAGIVQKIDRCLYKESSPGDVFILAMNCRGFIPVLRAIHEEGRTSEVAYWDIAQGELVSDADKFINLSDNIAAVTADPDSEV